MADKNVRLPLLPYLLAILLIGIAILLDRVLDRGSQAAAENFEIWPQVIQLISARLIFALLSVLLIWSLARLNLSRAGTWIFTVCGLLISAGPVLYFAGWLDFRWISGFLPGSYLPLSGAVLLAGGIVALLTASQTNDQEAVLSETRQDLP